MTIPEGLIPIAYDAGPIVADVTIERVRLRNGISAWIISGELESWNNISYTKFATLQDAYDELIKYRNSLYND